MPIGPGTPLGPYEVVSRIGSGGMGEVYKAWDPKLDRFVAIKVLPEFWQKDSTFLARFEREAKVLASLSHPNIVGIFDFGEVDGRAYAVMELLQGRTLRQALAGGPLPLRAALDIGAQTALGLSAAHRAGVIHRDLKPENIFLLDGGMVKLLDFGLAKKVVRREGAPDAFEEVHPTSTNAGVLMGTVGYMAPEQLQTEGVTDGRSDLFTLGCVLYEMLTGVRAFASETPMGTLHAILTLDPDLDRPELSAQVKELLSRCLDKRPEARFQDAQDLAFTLQTLGNPLPAAPTAPRRAVRRTWIWGLAGVGLAGLLVAAWALPGLRFRNTLPSYRPLSPEGGQVFAARFTGRGDQAVYSLRQEDEPPQPVRTAGGGEAELIAPLKGMVVLAHLGDGGWLALRGARQWKGGRERMEGDLLRADAQGAHLQMVAEGVSGADAAPDGVSFAVVRRAEDHDRLEAPLGTLRAESEGWIDTPRFDRSGRWLAYLDHPAVAGDGSAVVLVDLQSGRRRILSQGWSDLEGLAWSPSGEIWFTGARAEGPRAVFAVTPGGRLRPVTAAPEHLTLEDISPEGQVLLCQERQEAAVIARAPTGDPGVLGDPLALLDLSQDGKWVVLQAGGPAPAKVYLRELAGGTTALGTATLAAVDATGAKAALATQNADGWSLALWTRQGTTRIPCPAFNRLQQLAWEPGANALLLSGTQGPGGFRIWRLELDGGRLQPVCPEGISPDRPFLVSPDGRWLLAQAGPLLARFDLTDSQALPDTLAGVSPGERILGWGRDTGHVLVIGPRLPALVAAVDLRDGSRQPAFPVAAYGHAGALLDSGHATQAGEAFALGCRETRSRLFLVSGLR